MVKLVIRRYTREAGVRNLERSLAALARAAAVKVAEQESVVPITKDVHPPVSEPLLETRLAESAEVEMEVIPMNGVNNHEIATALKNNVSMIVDEEMLEKVLGVGVILLFLDIYLGPYNKDLGEFGIFFDVDT